ncbi:hypothetical protein B7494_g7835 [Chlorociboria aeruginascens]|nr:hypothetical protein B7494_g7835 [Chlorociboria aeruginascens]
MSDVKSAESDRETTTHSEDSGDEKSPLQQRNQNVQGQRTMQRARQQRAQQQQPDDSGATDNQIQTVPDAERMTGNMGGRTGAIRESRIKDRPQPAQERDSSLKIKIELDLEVEVDLYARVKGDVTIGLM